MMTALIKELDGLAASGSCIYGITFLHQIYFQ
jgi:hypothetical protein